MVLVVSGVSAWSPGWLPSSLELGIDVSHSHFFSLKHMTFSQLGEMVPMDTSHIKKCMTPKYYLFNVFSVLTSLTSDYY